MTTDRNSPKVRANLLTDPNAALLVARLESLGFRARVSGVGGSLGWPANAPYAQVMVCQADFERAKEELDRIKKKPRPPD